MPERGRGARLRDRFSERNALIVPGAANALAARVIADIGFEAVYVTGAGVSNTFLGMPDMGFVDLSEMARHTMAIRNAMDLPIIVDADAGYGNAVNVVHAVRMLELAGANAIQLEDQVVPKRCGHFTGKAVIPVEEARVKVSAAADARRSEDFLIIARTDARAVEGFEAALERAGRFIEAGADLTFVEALETEEEVRRVPQILQAPQVINLVLGGRTPVFAAADLAAMGYAMVLYANAALQGAVAGMTSALTALHREGRLDETRPDVTSFAERQRLVRKDHFDGLEAKYVTV